MTVDVPTELRKWLTALSDSDFGALLAVCDQLRHAAQMPPPTKDPRPPVRRELRAARAHAAKMSSHQLTRLAVGGLSVGARVLSAHCKFEPETVGDPDLDQLRRMLIALGSPFGRLVLFGLLLGDVPATALALRHRSDLEAALQDAGRSPVPALVEALERRGNPALALGSDMTAGVASIVPKVDPELCSAAVDAIENDLVVIRDSASRLAVLLRAVADDIVIGGEMDGEIDRSLAEYRQQRSAFFQALADVTGKAESADFDSAGALLVQFRAEELARKEEEETSRQTTEQAAAVARIAELRKQLGELEELVKSVPGNARESLQDAARAVEADIERLRATAELPLVETERLPEPVATTAGHFGEPASEQEPRSAEAVAPPPIEAVDTTETVTSPDSDDLAIGFPWEEGKPPLAVELAGSGRLVEAYWVTAMSGEPNRRSAVLRFAAAAYGINNNADATAVLAGLELDAQELAGDADAAALATTAALRAGLIAGWGLPTLTQLRPELVLPARWAALIDTTIDAVRRGFRIDDGLGGLLQENDAHEARTELGRRARDMAEELPRRKNSYQRATRVLQRLMITGQPLATALAVVAEWSEGTGDGQEVGSALAAMNAPGAIDAMIESADAAMRTPKQAREPIVAVALRTLVRAIEEVRTILIEADAVCRRLTATQSEDQAVATRLSRALADVESAEPPSGMSGVAMALFRRWLQRPNETIRAGYAAVGGGETSFSLSEPSPDVLLVLPDLPRDTWGRPNPEDLRTPVVLAELTREPDLERAVSAYCQRGDLRSARRLVELAGEGFWAVDQPVGPLREILEDGTRSCTKLHHAALNRARDLFARIRTQNLLDLEDETAVAGKLEALATVDDGAFDDAAASLAQLAEELDAKHRSRVEDLRSEIATLHVQADDHDRIVSLLDDGDTVTAAEFIAFIRAGKPLPEHVQEAAEDVKSFAEMVARQHEGTRAGAFAWSELAASGAALTPLANTGVQAWESLKNHDGLSGDRWANAVRDILRTLGLQPATRPQEINRGARRGFRKFRVQGTPSDGSYISTLGSAASNYTVTVVVEEHRGRRSVLDVLGPEDAGRANVVLYLHTMDLQSRRGLAAEATRSPVQALVIDPAVIGWVAANAPGSWRATQRITLPWTALNPYTPFVAGLVPPEVFVGRVREMAEVIDPNGGLFIYGGRQLGKSALLRRVEATFNDGEYRFAVYLDLKGRGIGEAEPASRIWRELVLELKKASVLSDRVSQDAPADVVVNQVRTWLDQHSGRRLLLLADEADAFLTADSRGTPTAGGVAHFPNVLRLKELMESTDRRFKVVFAGLHQVQRFGHLSNVPLVHGGPDILVGPLDQVDARRLVVAPLAALGYSFERPELVWRLLSATNYQASLIQIFCEELVRTLHNRVSHAQALPVPIRESDVEAVVGSDRVRARIAERLRITINLEDRYRVLTLVIALLSLKDRFSTDYGPEKLLQEAREHWPAGFEDLTASQVSIYLDEMVGLGLLIRLSGQSRYAVRSPNVVNMLGTKASLELELRETAFDLPYEYNPRDARRLLLSAQGVQRRSPLTDGQLFELAAVGAASVVTGTDALGVDRVPAALKDYAEMRGSRVEVHTSVADIAKAVTTAARRKRPTVMVADLRDRTVAEIFKVKERLAKDRLASVLVIDPSVAREVGVAEGVELVRPSRWTAGSLRSWPECPFDVLGSRVRLIEATGGWTELVEDVIAWVVVRGATQAQALGRVVQWSTDLVWARNFLDRAGVDQALITRIGPWVDYLDPGEVISTADVAVMLELDLGRAIELLDDLVDWGVLDESADGIMLDRVVHRCITTVREKS
ncbi:hypothetical protein [Saccharothrix sp. NRRL B-16314]|uniref:hypothetical protein n=1 Tax=Saccharothrix sp. NRRL B-16314 TaxID=1463825 RepID=UPI0012DC1CAB|nr:hypothetical protein [Saccharothrix sp. NRRL B-16314]